MGLWAWLRKTVLALETLADRGIKSVVSAGRSGKFFAGPGNVYAGGPGSPKYLQKTPNAVIICELTSTTIVHMSEGSHVAKGISRSRCPIGQQRIMKTNFPVDWEIF
eukprot:1016676-Pelagomonas_calceolata.AAC.2